MRRKRLEEGSKAQGPYWFFLGGRDLEMLAIRELLEDEYQGPYTDHELQWGAKASDYKNEISRAIERGYIPVLVELENDLDLQSSTVEIIDHHNEYAGANAPTPLEKVYVLLGKSLDAASEEHKAIVANDRGYAYEMRDKGFDSGLIRTIRRREWQATGITEKDIEGAKQSLRDELSIVGDICLVKASNDKAGLIADLLLHEFQNEHRDLGIPSEAVDPEILVVSGPSEWNVYAPGAVISSLRALEPEKSWTGGSMPMRGYWGILKQDLTEGKRPDISLEDLLTQINAQSYISKNEEKLLKDDLSILGSPNIDDDPASFTQFIVPISYAPSTVSENESAVCFERLCFEHQNGDISSKRKKFLNREMVSERRRYFTEETGNMLYQHAAWFELSEHDEKSAGFLLWCRSTGRYIEIGFSAPRLIMFNWNAALQEHRVLHIHENTLFNGFLILELYPRQKATLSELMELNETFRHLQTPFTEYYKKEQADRYHDLVQKGCPWPSAETADNTDSRPRAEGKGEYRTSSGKRFYANAQEWLTWGKWIDLLSIPVAGSTGSDKRNLFSIMPDDWLQNAADISRQKRWAVENHAFKPADPKAFIWSCATLSEDDQKKRRKLLIPDPTGSQPAQEACSVGMDPTVEAGDWIKFLNIDLPGCTGKLGRSNAAMLASSEYEKNWVSDPSRTYQRWAHYGTLYGFTSHSGCSILPYGKDPPFWRQWRTLYRDQALFLLYERATLFRFSRAISSLTQERLDTNHQSTEGRYAERLFRKRFSRLRQKFVYFANLYQFPLLSTEQQGLEMYKAQRESLDVDPLYREVQSQIDTAHAHAALVSQEKAVELTTRITVLGIPLLLASLIASILGMDVAIHHEALLEIANKFVSPEIMRKAREADGLVRALVWMVALLAVLLPVRFFENRLIDIKWWIPSVVRALTILALIGAVVALSALSIITEGFASIAASVIALALLIAVVHPFRRIGNALAERQAGGSFWRTLSALWRQPLRIASISSEFSSVIETEAERSEYRDRNSS